MTTRDKFTAHLFRLVHGARSVAMKRALSVVDQEPRLDFWRLIHGNQLDIAVLEWCKVFGSDGEPTHWKRIVPKTAHRQFRDGLLASAGITADVWAQYWEDMKLYRDNLGAHHNESIRVAAYPRLDLALSSSAFYYGYLIKELRSMGELRFPDNLELYTTSFEQQARDVASRAVEATNGMKEGVF